MTDNQKIILWFLVCFALAFYLKFSGLNKIIIGHQVVITSGTVLGQQTSKQTFGDLLKKSP